LQQNVKPGGLLEFTVQQLLHVIEATTEGGLLVNPFHPSSLKLFDWAGKSISFKKLETL
jgi:hypothetical protein